MTGKVLVAGVGNIFLGDDAFGVEVVRRLIARGVTAAVEVRDFGIRSFDLAYALMEEWQLVLLIDALPRGGEPGTLYVLEPQMPEDNAISPDLDAHTMDPVSVLRLVSALGGKVGRMLVIGCEPASFEFDAGGNMGLSAPVSAAANEAVRMVEDIVCREGHATAA
jgi:hydrogenase maturation protease